MNYLYLLTCPILHTTITAASLDHHNKMQKIIIKENFEKLQERRKARSLLQKAVL